MPASTSGTKYPFCVNINQLFIFYHSAAPTTHKGLRINIINSTNHHLQHAKLRILLQHLTSHAAYERSGGPSKRPAAKRPCTYYDHSHLHGVEAAPWDLVMQTRKGNVACATSAASSGPPTSPPLLCCCFCAAVVVLRSTCVSALYS